MEKPNETMIWAHDAKYAVQQYISSLEVLQHTNHRLLADAIEELTMAKKWLEASQGERIDGYGETFSKAWRTLLTAREMVNDCVAEMRIHGAEVNAAIETFDVDLIDFSETNKK